MSTSISSFRACAGSASRRRSSARVCWTRSPRAVRGSFLGVVDRRPPPRRDRSWSAWPTPSSGPSSSRRPARLAFSRRSKPCPQDGAPKTRRETGGPSTGNGRPRSRGPNRPGKPRDAAGSSPPTEAAHRRGRQDQRHSEVRWRDQAPGRDRQHTRPSGASTNGGAQRGSTKAGSNGAPVPKEQPQGQPRSAKKRPRKAR